MDLTGLKDTTGLLESTLHAFHGVLPDIATDIEIPREMEATVFFHLSLTLASKIPELALTVYFLFDAFCILGHKKALYDIRALRSQRLRNIRLNGQRERPPTTH